MLVVGAGNSGVDIACDAAFAADQAFLSVRRGYHFLPKHIFGMPSDVFAARGLWLEQRVMGARRLCREGGCVTPRRALGPLRGRQQGAGRSGGDGDGVAPQLSVPRASGVVDAGRTTRSLSGPVLAHPSDAGGAGLRRVRICGLHAVR
ncbi:MAG: hypothetical protein KTR31_34860 [Myxococcales bacterium]|nr:hypothetical protein [Myxococcales bacterium]